MKKERLKIIQSIYMYLSLFGYSIGFSLALLITKYLGEPHGGIIIITSLVAFTFLGIAIKRLMELGNE